MFRALANLVAGSLAALYGLYLAIKSVAFAVMAYSDPLADEGNELFVALALVGPTASRARYVAA